MQVDMPVTRLFPLAVLNADATVMCLVTRAPWSVASEY